MNRVKGHLFLFILLVTGFIPAAHSAVKIETYDARQAYQFAETLQSQQRFQEMTAYIESKLGALPDSPDNYVLLLLLSEGYVKTGKLELAATALDEAEQWANTPAKEKSLSRARMDLKVKRWRTQQEVPDVPEKMTLHTIASDSTALTDETLITNSFFETDLRNVLSDLAMESGIPILYGAGVNGLVTYDAVDQPLPRVLQAILEPLGFTYSFDGENYFVGSLSPTDPAFALLSTTKVITLSNTEATDAVQQLAKFFEPYVKASKLTNSVCITGSQALVNRIEADLTQLDKPPTQLSIDVIIAEISSNGLKKMGLDWSLSHANPDGSTNLLGTNNTDISGAGLVGEYSDLSTDILGFNADVLFSLEALLQSGEAKIRANPRLTTMHGRTADIELVRDQYFIIQTGSSSQFQYNTLQSVSSGIKLEITPYVSLDSEITVKVKPEVGDVVGEGQGGLPEINTRSASTSVRVHDGETFSIGGLSIESHEKFQKKVPILGSIPLIGYLFRYEEDKSKESEVVIFVTPRILVG